jgi:uncharacterized protein (TIGR03086 family)
MIDLYPAVARLSALIEAVPGDGLDRPTPCSDYSVGDLLDHIAGITVAFGGAAVKAEGETADMGPQGDASRLDTDWRVSLPERLGALGDAWQDPNAWAGMTRIGGRDIPGEVAGIVTFGELAVHGWDLSQATSVPFQPDPVGVEPLLALVHQTFESGQDPPRGSAFGPAVAVGEDASTFDQVLGLLGRNPGWSP